MARTAPIGTTNSAARISAGIQGIPSWVNLANATAPIEGERELAEGDVPRGPHQQAEGEQQDHIGQRGSSDLLTRKPAKIGTVQRNATTSTPAPAWNRQGAVQAFSELLERGTAAVNSRRLG